MRSVHTMLAAAGVAAALATAVPVGAQAAQTYPQTLYWGSGLVDIPTAWVAPLSGDFAINYSGKTFEKDPDSTKINYSGKINSQLMLSMSAFGRVELGYAAYSSNPEWGFFGKALLLREDDFRGQLGLARWVPGIAVGFRNLGPYRRIDRFGTGYVLLPPLDPTTSGNYRHVVDSLHKDFDTQTFYGVVTKGISLNQIRANWADVDFSVSVGYGNGLFKDHGSIPVKDYAKHSTGGLFYGIKTTFIPTRNVSVDLLAENNAWDYNVGLSADYRGLRAGLYLTELGAGSAKTDRANLPTFYYNYQKTAFVLTWQSNIFALLRGDFLQNRAAALERERQGLLAEIEQRRQRIASLELELNRYEAQNLLELEQRRAAAEAELRQEREALRRLEERLNTIERTNPPANPTNNPPANPSPNPNPPANSSTPPNSPRR
jgi:hypothetical protein